MQASVGSQRATRLYDGGLKTRPEEALERDLVGFDRAAHGAAIQFLRKRDVVLEFCLPRSVGIFCLLYTQLSELWIGYDRRLSSDVGARAVLLTPPHKLSVAIQPCPAGVVSRK